MSKREYCQEGGDIRQCPRNMVGGVWPGLGILIF